MHAVRIFAGARLVLSFNVSISFQRLPPKAIYDSPKGFTATGLTIRHAGARFYGCCALRTRCITSRWSFQVASSNAWRWLARWLLGPQLYWLTNLPETWILRTPK